MIHYLESAGHSIAASMFGAGGAITTFIALTESDWARITGPVGGLVIAAICLFGLAAYFVVKTKKEDQTNEKRHAESLKLQRELLDKVFEIQGEQAKIQIRTTVAVESVDRTLQYMTAEMAKRPCQAQFRHPVAHQEA